MGRWFVRACGVALGALALLLGIAETRGLLRRIEGESKPTIASLIVWGALCVLFALACLLFFRRGGHASGGARRRAPTGLLILGTMLGSFAAVALTLMLIVGVAERIAGHSKPAVGALILVALLALPLSALPVECLRALRARWSSTTST
jgi:hypothetical protein